MPWRIEKIRVLMVAAATVLVLNNVLNYIDLMELRVGRQLAAKVDAKVNEKIPEKKVERVQNEIDKDEKSSKENEEENETLIERNLSINLGGGNCEWTAPVDADQNAPLFSTLVVGYPGSGKRTVFLQLEGLTGLTIGASYSLVPRADKQYAFRKTSYPHREGTWTWAKVMDQVIYVIRNPRWAIPAYHDIRKEIEYAGNFEEAYQHENNVYTSRSELEEWRIWRSDRVMSEIKVWGWYVDFWMEGGILRDIENHDYVLTQQEFDFMISARNANEDVAETHTWDFHCINDVTDCKPVVITSYEKLLDPRTGPVETAKFGRALQGRDGITVIEEEAWECVWRELIVKGKGLRTIETRPGPAKELFVFTAEEKVLLRSELVRLRDKYSSGVWIDDPIAIELVDNLKTYIAENDREDSLGA